MSAREQQEQRLIELVEGGTTLLDDLAQATGLAPSTVRVYYGTGWTRLRPGQARPLLDGSGRMYLAPEGGKRGSHYDREQLVEERAEEEADRRLREHLLRTPSEEELRERLRRNGKRELPTGTARLRYAPTFGGLTVSREHLEERMALAFARVAGHLHFDELTEAQQSAYGKLAASAVLALELVERDLRAAAGGEARWL